MITFDRVSKRYPGGQQALANLSFSLARGEFAFVTGHSGAGKSTLLKLVLGIEKPSGGKLVVNGNEMGLISSKMLSLHRRQIGTVFQDHQLLNDRSVYDNVALPLEISGLDPREGKRRVRAALDKVGLLSKEKLLPMALSGGEQQRVGIARAVVNTPRACRVIRAGTTASSSLFFHSVSSSIFAVAARIASYVANQTTPCCSESASRMRVTLSAAVPSRAAVGTSEHVTAREMSLLP